MINLIFINYSNLFNVFARGNYIIWVFLLELGKVLALYVMLTIVQSENSDEHR